MVVIGAFYEAFEPAEANRLIDRFEFVFTPKHGGAIKLNKPIIDIEKG